MKNILVLGNDGYIGSHVEAWLKKYNDLDVKGICIKNDVWKNTDFQGVDAIVDTVGMAHIQPKKKLKPLFYSINTDMTISLCEKSKKAGVGQFIFFEFHECIWRPLWDYHIYGSAKAKWFLR
ncbi:MAG: NAD-dependent epimerase/dehydratase family protein [Staphylococcus aureus]